VELYCIIILLAEQHVLNPDKFIQFNYKWIQQYLCFIEMDKNKVKNQQIRTPWWAFSSWFSGEHYYCCCL